MFCVEIIYNFYSNFHFIDIFFFCFFFNNTFLFFQFLSEMAINLVVVKQQNMISKTWKKTIIHLKSSFEIV